MRFLALYDSGHSSVNRSRLVAISSDEHIVQDFARRLVEDPRLPEEEVKSPAAGQSGRGWKDGNQMKGRSAPNGYSISR